MVLLSWGHLPFWSFLMHCVNISTCFCTNVSMQAKLAWTLAQGLRLWLKNLLIKLHPVGVCDQLTSDENHCFWTQNKTRAYMFFFLPMAKQRLSIHNFIRFFTSLPVAVARDFNNACSSLLHRAPMKINRPRSRGTSSSIRQSVVRL